MSSVLNAQLGIVDEVTYGTAVAVTKFYPFISESIEGKYEDRIESEGIKAGRFTLDGTRFSPNAKGAEGELELEVETKNFPYLFKHMFGAVSTGSTAAGVTPHTFTPGDLRGKFFTVQVGRPDSEGTVNPYTYSGGKITEWELACAVDEFLKLNLTCDFQKENFAGADALALQAASFPSGSQLLAFHTGSLTIDGTAVNVKEVTISASNGLDLERYFIRDSGLKREPIQMELREFEVEIKVEYENDNMSALVASALAADVLGEVVVTFTAPVAESGGGFAELEITVPNLRFDTASATVGGYETIEQTLSGKATEVGSTKAITAVFTSPDATV